MKKKINSSILFEASEDGDLETVKCLISKNDLTETQRYINMEALELATEFGHIDIVKTLIPASGPDLSEALRLASKAGFLKIVEALLPFSNPKMKDSWPLREAAARGHLEVVKLLIPVSDPKAADSLALTWAIDNGRTEVVKTLLPVSDIDKAVTDLVNRNELEKIDDILPVLTPEYIKTVNRIVQVREGYLNRMPYLKAYKMARILKKGTKGKGLFLKPRTRL